MKKYTKKQIEKAFVKWQTLARLQPQKIMTDEVARELSVEEFAKECTRALLEYMD